MRVMARFLDFKGLTLAVALVLGQVACGSGGGSDPVPPPAPPPVPACSTLPSVPTSLLAPSLASQSIVLRWAASTSGANCTVQYSVYQDGAQVAQLRGTRVTITGLAAGTTYSFTVAASNGFGSSAQSAALAVTTKAVEIINPAIQIRTWVPPYEFDKWKAALNADTGGTYKPSNTLTSVGAQFFHIDTNGAVFLAGPSPADVQWVADYCSTNSMKFLLCVTNFDTKWNWDLAISAFDTHRADLINNLVAAVTTYGADGVNIDFEGIVDEGVAHRPAFATFIQELGTRLHAMGKELSVAVFPAQWNAPAITWIGDWDGYVDGIDSMGYEALFGGPGDDAWGAYKWQQDTALAAGYSYGQFDMGMPGSMGSWGKNGLGTSLLDHLDELQSGIYNTKPTSICIWDAQFNGSGWLSAEVWQALHTIRTSPAPAP